MGDAVAEGRRIYMGNLLYSVKPADVEDVLQQTGFQYEKIHISVDPISGRNPGYCFVEFPTREEAERALTDLQGVSVYDRPVKLGPCHPKTNSRDGGADSPRRNRDGRTGNAGTWGSSSPAKGGPTFQRWGDWSGDRSPAAAQQDEQGPYGALKHLEEAKESTQMDGKRLYVGGLGKMENQNQNDEEIRGLFAGFDVVAIGKRITPHASTRVKPGNHHYCFVDFSSQEEAERAMNATNKMPYDGGFLRVNLAKGKMPKDENRGELLNNEDNLPPNNGSPARRGPRFNSSNSHRSGGEESPARGGEDREQRQARQKVIMQSNDWRRGAGAN